MKYLKLRNTTSSLLSCVLEVTWSATSDEGRSSVKTLLDTSSYNSSKQCSICIKMTFHTETSNWIICCSMVMVISNYVILEFHRKCNVMSTVGPNLCTRSQEHLFTSRLKCCLSQVMMVSRVIYGVVVSCSTRCCMERYLSEIQPKRNLIHRFWLVIISCQTLFQKRHVTSSKTFSKLILESDSQWKRYLTIHGWGCPQLKARLYLHHSKSRRSRKCLTLNNERSILWLSQNVISLSTS